jgi:hypothetical protein
MSCLSKIECSKCGKHITKNNFSRHDQCCFGPKEKSKFSGHRGGWNKGLTKETNSSIKQQVETLAKKIDSGEYIPKGYPHSEEFKIKQSLRAKERKLGGHTSKITLRYVTKTGEVVFLQSSYEIKFAELLDKMNVDWIRPEPINYIGEDQQPHRYYPDFKVGDKFFDTKNDYLAVKDKPKIDRVMQQNNIVITIVKKEMITEEFIASII